MLIEITYNVTDVYMSTTETPVYVEISFEQPGGTSAVWGSITGTLSNQTDLQNALNAKLDESTIDGGTEGQILSKASATDFDFAWINNYAKYLSTNVRNQTGSTIAAFQVVYISGATGNKPLISLADADTEATSSKTYGVTATAIANNGTGDVVTAGELSGINTSAFNEGDLLWLSTTAGGVVTTPPAEPAHAVFIGYVIRSHPTLGVVDVAIANGYELNELHGVQITTPTDNQGLFYNSTSTLWENKSIATALGFTPVPTSRTITINGVTFDLSADRTYTIAAGISGSGAAGQVTYWTGTSAVSGSNNLFWDNANGRLGIGTNAPATTLDVRGTISGTTTSVGNMLSLTGANNVTFNVKTQTTPNGSGQLELITNPSATANAGAYMIFSGYEEAWINVFSRQASTNNKNFRFGNLGRLNYFAIQKISDDLSAVVGTPLTIFSSTGNVLLQGNGTSTTDLAVRLGVIGDTLLRGSGNTNSTTALTVQNSSSTNLFVVRNDGNVGIGTNAPAYPLHINYTNNSYAAGLFVNNTNLGTQALSGIYLQVNNVLGGAITYQPSNYILASQQSTVVFASAGNNKIGFIANSNQVGVAQDIYFLTYGGNSTRQLQIVGSSNNVIVNGTTDSTSHKFQVYGDTLLRGSGATSATTALTVQNSSSTNLFTVSNDGNVGLRSTIPAVVHSSTAFMFVGQSASLTGGLSVNDIAFNNNSYFDGTNSIYKNSGFASTLFLDNAGDIRLFTAASGTVGSIVPFNEMFRLFNNGNLIIQNGGTYSNISSSRLTINSTTQGFLPPRMTTTQKNAIATPAAGLVVYDTTLNKLCVYTTAWETITSI